MLDLALVNITDLSVKRPDRSGPGGDVVGTTTVHSGLNAIFQPRERLMRTPDGREIAIRSVFWLDPVDGDGDQLDVQPGDFLAYTDWDGSTREEREVVRVAPWYCSTTIDNIEVEIGAG